MANRRMFSKAIIGSAKFLKMPLETQALYFHLALNADDDGVVEGFMITRMIGSSEDSMRVLTAKNYIKVLNEDLVIFIVDWLEHNKIRADRKVDSIHKHLLEESVPDIQLLEAKERADRKKDDSGTSQGQPMVGIGKVRLGKVSINNNTCIDDFFEKIWKLYPVKKGKASISKTQKNKLYKVGFEELERAIQRYDKEVTDRQYMKHGSTFFNKGYLDYLDETYQEREAEKAPQQQSRYRRV